MEPSEEMPRRTRRPKNITKRLVDSTKPDPSRVIKVTDAALPGFGILVYPTGAVSFFTDYGDRAHRQRFILGKYGSLTVEQAREMARRVRSDFITKGIDPNAEKRRKREEPKALRFKEWVGQYIERAKRKKLSWRDDERYLGEAVTLFGSKPLKEVDAADIERAFQRAVKRGDTTANRFRASIRACFRLALKQRLIPFDPTATLEGMPEGEPRTRTLTDEELGRLLGVLEREPDPWVYMALQLMILTGCRLSDALRAKREDFDLGAQTWVIPTAKSGRREVIPLPEPLLEMLRNVPERGPYLIPGRKLGTHRTSLTRPWARIRKDAELRGVILHDLRRTFGKEVAKRHGLHMASKLLRHSSVKVTERHYTPLELSELQAATDTVAQERAGRLLKFRKGGAK